MLKKIRKLQNNHPSVQKWNKNLFKKSLWLREFFDSKELSLFKLHLVLLGSLVFLIQSKKTHWQDGNYDENRRFTKLVNCQCDDPVRRGSLEIRRKPLFLYPHFSLCSIFGRASLSIWLIEKTTPSLSLSFITCGFPSFSLFKGTSAAVALVSLKLRF